MALVVAAGGSDEASLSNEGANQDGEIVDLGPEQSETLMAEIKTTEPPEGGIPAASVLWRIKLDERKIGKVDSGLRVQGQIVLDARGQTVRAIDLDKGEEVWSFKTESLVSAVQEMNHVVYFWTYGLGNSLFATEQSVYALDVQTGQELWNFTGLGAMVDKVGEDGVQVMVGGDNPQIRTLDPFSGAEISRKSLKPGQYVPPGYTEMMVRPGSQAIVGDRRYTYSSVGTDPTKPLNRIEAFDMEGNDVTWGVTIEGEGEETNFYPNSYPRIVADEKSVYAVGFRVARYVEAFDADDGAPLWSIDGTSIPEEVQSQPGLELPDGLPPEARLSLQDPQLIRDRLVLRYVSLFDAGGLVAINTSTGQLEWISAPARFMTGVVFNSRSGCFGHNDRQSGSSKFYLTCINGKGIGWRTLVVSQLGANGLSGQLPVVATDELVIASINGNDSREVIAVDAETGIPQWIYRTALSIEEDVFGSDPYYLAGDKVLMIDGPELVAVASRLE